MIWHHGEDDLKILLEKLNNFHPSITFTSEYFREKFYYLDVKVIGREGKLITDIYVKQTDSHQYLDLYYVIHTTVLNRYLIVKHLR